MTFYISWNIQKYFSLASAGKNGSFDHRKISLPYSLMSEHLQGKSWNILKIDHIYDTVIVNHSTSMIMIDMDLVEY